MAEHPTPSNYAYPPLARWLVLIIVAGSLAILGLWALATPDHVHGKADAIGYAICHRIPDRSFTAFGQQLPLCARCTGIYLGVMTGFAVFVASGRRRASQLPNWQIGAVLAFFVVILGIDGTNSYFHLFPGFEHGLYEPNNTLRLITGMYCGLALITLVMPVFNNIMWQQVDRQRIINNWRELAGLLLVATLVLAATLTRRPLILLVFGLLSAAGVVLILTMVNSVMLVTVLRRERAYTSLADMWLPLLGGAAMSFVLIGAIDYVRFALTGTWDGFNFPTAFWSLWMFG